MSKCTLGRQRILNVAAIKEGEPLNRTGTRSESFLPFSDCYFTAKSCRNIFVYNPQPSPKKPSSAFRARKGKAAKFSRRCLLPLLLQFPFFKRSHTQRLPQIPFFSVRMDQRQCPNAALSAGTHSECLGFPSPIIRSQLHLGEDFP